VEKISLLVDGELDEPRAQREVGRLGQPGVLREHWDTFHLIGDALRGERILSPEFGRRFAERLAREPTVLAPPRPLVRKATAYALSAAASLAAVALVGWVAIGVQTEAVPPAEIARAPAVVVQRAPPIPKPQLASVPYDGTLNEYLMAHTGFSPSTVIQGVAPYIRTVATSQPARDR
jgi:sigma-E factor negative regulatory protein RseA